MAGHVEINYTGNRFQRVRSQRVRLQRAPAYIEQFLWNIFSRCKQERTRTTFCPVFFFQPQNTTFIPLPLPTERYNTRNLLQTTITNTMESVTKTSFHSCFVPIQNFLQKPKDYCYISPQLSWIIYFLQLQFFPVLEVNSLCKNIFFNIFDKFPVFSLSRTINI